MTLHRQANTRPGPFREWLDPEALRAVNDDRPDMGDWLRSRAVPERPVVTRSAKLLVGFVWIACVAYCAALWMGLAS